MLSSRISSFFSIFYAYLAPLLSVILMMLGNGFFITFISLSLDQQQFSRDTIGLIQSAYYFGMLAGAFKMEELIRRIGHVQSLTVFGSLATSAILAQSLDYNVLSWFILRFISGVSLAAIYIVIESWMLSHSDKNSRGTILSLYMISLYGAQSISQQFLSFMDLNSSLPFIVAALLISLSTIPVGLSTKRTMIPQEVDPLKFLKIIESSPFGSTSCVVAGLILSSLLSFFPLYAFDKGISAANLMTVTIAGGVLLQWPIGYLSDIFERRKVLLSVVLASAFFALLLFIYSGTNNALILTLAFLIGGCTFTLYPLGVTQACDHLQDHHITKATAHLLILYGVGAVLGPVTVSQLIESYSIYALFFYCIALLIPLSLLGLRFIFRRKKITIDEQNSFLPLTRTTHVAYEMDPRMEDADAGYQPEYQDD